MSNTMHQASFLEAFKARRELLGITQEHLAELAGVALRTLKSLEKGNGNPTLSTLMKLSDVLGLEIKLDIKR